jgi:Sporulation and spore germination
VIRRLVLAFALLCVAAACSVPRDDQARIVTNEKPNPSAPPSRPAGARTQAKVYFVRSSDNILEAVSTAVRVQSVGAPPGPYEVLEALILDGPPRDEDRLESKIPRNVRFEVRRGPDTVPNEVIVILPNFNVKAVNREALILAFQQMVFTLTELPDVNSVQFSVNNKLYKVPLRSGGDKPEGLGVRRQDYDLSTIYTTTTAATTTTAPASTSASTTAPGAGASVPPGSAPTDSVTPSTSR